MVDLIGLFRNDIDRSDFIMLCQQSGDRKPDITGSRNGDIQWGNLLALPITCF